MPRLLLALALSLLIAIPFVPAQQQRPQVPEGAKVLRDLAYLPDNIVRHRLDLYLPKDAAEPCPLVIWIHGGAWQGGSKNGTPGVVMLKHGFAVASINYRLTDAAPYPAQIEDCKAAVRWLRAKAKEYNLDPQRFGAWGASAGGHLVALLGTTSDMKELEGKDGNLEQSCRVQAVCDWFGPTDLTGMRGNLADNPDGPVYKLLGGPPSEKSDLARLASPVKFCKKECPPFLIMHGDKDNLVPLRQSQIMESALKKEGVPVELVVVEGKGHGTLGADAVKKVESFFLDALKKK